MELLAVKKLIKKHPGQFYTYILKRPNREPFYIGKGNCKGFRIEQHTWNKGLTKETGATGGNKKGYQPWNTGLGKSGMTGKHHSEETKRKIRETKKGVSTMTEEGKRSLSKQRKGVPLSKEHCKNIGIGAKGRVGWNKGLTKETDHRVDKISKALLERGRNL